MVMNCLAFPGTEAETIEDGLPLSVKVAVIDWAVFGIAIRTFCDVGGAF